MTWSKSKRKCLRDDNAALTPADRYERGRSLAHAGEFEAAIAALQLADATDPRVLNYLGFASRKSGRMDEAMAYYEAALRIDPDFTLARSYMGQALLSMGDRDGAVEQLRLIRAVAGPVALEYVMLRDALNAPGKTY